ncbi:hypothetical protein [Crystallibacter crystallopoietes]|nr:hypothetical protein [Arthrobacter crystallopoietes]
MAQRIHRYTESADYIEWANLLCSIALVETNERRLLIRGVEWTFHVLAFGRSGLTLGPFQLRNSPWKLSSAIERLILLARRRQIGPELADLNLSNFAKLWYGHDFVETGSALSYPAALKIAASVVATP